MRVFCVRLHVVTNGKTPQKWAKRASAVIWTQRYVHAGMTGLLTDASRPSGRKRIRLEKIAEIVEATLKKRPSAATHWSTRTMARAHGVSAGEDRIRRLWSPPPGRGEKPCPGGAG